MTDLIDGNECTSHISDISKMLIVSCKEKKQQNPQWFCAYYSCIVIISYILSLIYISVLCTVYDQDVAGGVLKNVTR